jgi:hemin uptake protein HemP
MQIRFALSLCLALAPLAAAPFDWSSVPPGKWVRIPANGTAAPKVFHGGAAIAPERGEVYFFGSDTHDPSPYEVGESNSVWRLDLVNFTWSQDYPQDPKTDYRILDDGSTETTTGRPWAMHTYAAVAWDPTVKRMVVVSHPGHSEFNAKRRFRQFKGDWYRDLAPMHWEYDPATKKWTRIQTNAPRLFSQALVWDPDHKQLIGHDGAKTYHFDRARNRWIAYDAPSESGGYHRRMVYDTAAHRVLLLGNNTPSSTLYSYDPEAHRWSEVQVKGWCLPAVGPAMAYDTVKHKLLYLANDHTDRYQNPTGHSATFLYDSEDQYWARIECESPELYGMNYLTQYVPGHQVVLHFEKSRDSDERIAIWAFRIP